MTPESLHENDRFTALAEFESWVATDWLYELGSPEAQSHARAKLDEEAKELSEALESGDPEDIVSELGDVLWTSSANAINAGIGIEASLRREQLSRFGDAPVTLEKIDEVALQLIPDEPIGTMASWIIWMSHYVGKASKQWRNLKDLVDENSPPSATNDGGILLKRARAQDGITQTVLVCSALAQRYADRSISEVIAANVEKLALRKAAGLPLTKLPKKQLSYC